MYFSHCSYFPIGALHTDLCPDTIQAGAQTSAVQVLVVSPISQMIGTGDSLAPKMMPAPSHPSIDSVRDDGTQESNVPPAATAVSDVFRRVSSVRPYLLLSVVNALSFERRLRCVVSSRRGFKMRQIYLGYSPRSEFPDVPPMHETWHDLTRCAGLLRIPIPCAYLLAVLKTAASSKAPQHGKSQRRSEHVCQHA